MWVVSFYSCFCCCWCCFLVSWHNWNNIFFSLLITALYTCILWVLNEQFGVSAQSKPISKMSMQKFFFQRKYKALVLHVYTTTSGKYSECIYKTPMSALHTKCYHIAKHSTWIPIYCFLSVDVYVCVFSHWIELFCTGSQTTSLTVHALHFLAEFKPIQGKNWTFIYFIVLLFFWCSSTRSHLIYLHVCIIFLARHAFFHPLLISHLLCLLIFAALFGIGWLFIPYGKVQTIWKWEHGIQFARLLILANLFNVLNIRISGRNIAYSLMHSTNDNLKNVRGREI